MSLPLTERECVKTAIAIGAAQIEELSKAVEVAKAETKAAVRDVTVQVRYASRVQNAARQADDLAGLNLENPPCP